MLPLLALLPPPLAHAYDICCWRRYARDATATLLFATFFELVFTHLLAPASHMPADDFADIIFSLRLSCTTLMMPPRRFLRRIL
jgi:hypothetical protein